VAKQKVNPWAICHAQLGKEKTDKFERCVMKIKAKHGIKEMVNRYLNKRDLREKVILLGKAKEREQAKEIAAVHQKPTKHQQTVQQITRAGKMGSGKSHGAGERTARAYLKKDHTEYEGPSLAEQLKFIKETSQATKALQRERNPEFHGPKGGDALRRDTVKRRFAHDPQRDRVRRMRDKRKFALAGDPNMRPSLQRRLSNDSTSYEGPTLAETKDWIQGAEADIKRRGTEGKCTPITKPGCTGKAKALAKTFKKMAKQKARGK
jgi:hypothetical protein